MCIVYMRMCVGERGVHAYWHYFNIIYNYYVLHYILHKYDTVKLCC